MFLREEGVMVRVGVSVIGVGVALFIAATALAAERSAFIDVAGAPGDGEQALKRALSNRLQDEGFAIRSMPAADAYEIQGMVRLAPAARGKEDVRIDWTIFGPEGTRLGNVTQVKEIRKGSLDRHWGAAADAAADAAAHDILKLLPH
jgi:hypothetical protein